MKEHKRVAVVGLGHIGMFVVLHFSQVYKVVGYDIDKSRIDELKQGVDRNQLLTKKAIQSAHITYTHHIDDLETVEAYIVCVPTLVDQHKKPEIKNMCDASDAVGSVLKPGDLVVYESTVYPGFTEDVCIPILEARSGLKAGKDFFVGYSPERISIGDGEHDYLSVKKLISGKTARALEEIQALYGLVLKNNLVPTSSIRVAEAAKLAENIQRDVLIAYANELSQALHKMDISVYEVLAAASTKWNFSPIKPGLVGGDCIAVNPYYFIHQCDSLGFEPQLMLDARKINESMARFVADAVLAQLTTHSSSRDGYKVAVLGATFKENTASIHNSVVFELVDCLEQQNVIVTIHDPAASAEEVNRLYGKTLTDWEAISNQDAVVITTAHDAYATRLPEKYSEPLKKGGVLFDLKGIFTKTQFADIDIVYCDL